LMVLKRALDATEDEARGLASRILQRMHERGPAGRLCKPLLYAGTTVDGVAAAVAIYDDFWTTEW
jgi:hypothetical protein